jgi:PAS domain S-box-containing protein
MEKQEILNEAYQQNMVNEAHRYEALFNHASMGIVVVNSKSIIQSVNPFALHLFGYTIEELIGKPIEILIPIRYHDRHVSHTNAYRTNPKNRSMGNGMDLFAIKKDGKEFSVEVSLGNYEVNDDKHVIAFISDISVRKKAEKEFDQLNDELEATVEKRTHELTEAMHQLEQSKEDLAKLLRKEKDLSELKSRFVSMASHEFRTPLSTVLSSAYLIKKYITEAEQSKRDKHIDRIISSVNMLTDILNDFLSVGKIEEGKMQVKLSEFDIEETMVEIIEEIKNNIKNQQTIQYIHSGDKIVQLDASMLKHIVLNLLSNASKFSPENSKIEVTTNVTQHQYTLTIQDYGMGISISDQEHLMERFFRGSNAENIQGTGLGLHIVSKYAEVMNGTVVCKSELEKGTTFIVTFTPKKS